MKNGHYSVPLPKNETVLSYAPGTAERARLKEVLAELKSILENFAVITGNKVFININTS
jgi:1-pyrroline-5-carboxylate dehydrogenase